MNGSYWQRVLLLGPMVGVLTLEWALWAKPIIVPPLTSKEADVTTVLLSDKVLGPILIGNVVQLLWYLWKSIKAEDKKKLEKIEAAVEHIPILIHTIQRLDEHVKDNLLTREQTELLIWKHMRDRKE